MSSNTNWLDYSNTGLRTNTYFNNKLAMTFGGVAQLTELLITPNVWDSLFSNPSDWISGLMYFPFDVTYQGGQATGNLRVGNHDTDITVKDINASSLWFNLGEFYVGRYFNNFADYNGYTKIEVWLPYFGFVSVEPTEVMGKYLEFALSVDIGTGQGVYYVGVSDTSISALPNIPQYAGVQFQNTRILSTHTLQLGYQIPVGSTNSADVYRNIIMGAVKASAVAVGAYAVGAVGGATATTKSTTVKTVRNPKTNRQITQSKMTRESVTDTTAYLKGKAVTEIFDYSADALSSMHMGGNSDVVNNPAIMCNGSNSIKVIIYRPKLKPVNEDYLHLYGAPLGETKSLSTLSGYTEIGEVHLESSYFGTATENELAMINEQLLNGVILP